MSPFLGEFHFLSCAGRWTPRRCGDKRGENLFSYYLTRLFDKAGKEPGAGTAGTEQPGWDELTQGSSDITNTSFSSACL